MMNTSRRRFLTSAAQTACALPFVGWKSLASARSLQHTSSFDPWIEVHREHLRMNVEEIHRRVSGRPVLAVIKNNGYGLGVANVARLLEPSAAIAGFAVVKVHEAMTLRDAGIRKPILLMGPFSDTELRDAIGRDIMPMVYTPIGSTLEKIGAKRQKPVQIHICVDTGIGRVGVPHSQAASLIRDLSARKAVSIAGVMMTFTEDAEFDKEQLRRFSTLCGELERERIAVGRKHAVSSYGLFQHPDAYLDMVRPGMAIYGIYPEQEFRKAGLLLLRPAVSLRARVAYVKQLKQGETAGYNRAYVASSDMWVATLPVGHADGIPRTAAKGGRVRIGDRLYPIIASVSASHTIVEIGREPRVTIGDVATVFGWDEGARPEDLALACGCSVYDLTMHLNPLLPRRIVSQ